MADITPSTMATQLATSYTARAQSLLTSQTKAAQATSTALTKLQSALTAFNSALTGLAGSAGKSMVQRTTSLSTTGFATATASASAPAGGYSMFVQQVATPHQVAFEDLPAVPVSLGGPLVVKLQDGTDFTVALTQADSNNDGTISQSEIARAINQANDNQGKVTATTATVDGKTQLVLSSGKTGENGRITLDTSGLPNGALKTALSTSKELSPARDAVVYLFGDASTGTRLQQSSNTVTAIDGVTVTLTKAMQAGDSPLVLTVGNDDSGTTANVQKFVDAYNALEKTLDELTATGADSTTRAAFASDAGLRSLRDRMSSVLRQSHGGMSLSQFGISTDRSGNMTLDSAKLQKTLAAHPEGLDTLFGNAGLTGSSGLLGAFGEVVKSWTDTSKGHIQQRKASLDTQQRTLAARQTRLDNQYDMAYKRYLAQFTQLQNLQSLMSDNGSLLSNLGAS